MLRELSHQGRHPHPARDPRAQPISPADTALADALDNRRGVLFSSSFEFPGRYTRWDMGFVDPPLVLTARGRTFCDRGAERARPHSARTRSREAICRPLGGRHPSNLATTASRARSAKARRAFPKSSAAGSPAIFSVLRALDRSVRAAPRTSISGFTAPSATIWCSSSSRCSCACRVPATSAISSSICRTRS